MNQQPQATPLPLPLKVRFDMVYRQLEHHTSLETLNRYRDEGRLEDWDSICDQLVDHYWWLDTQVKSTAP